MVKKFTSLPRQDEKSELMYLKKDQEGQDYVHVHHLHPRLDLSPFETENWLSYIFWYYA
jgi:hypothetical protein